MIDPTVITNFNLNRYQLQEMAAFWLLVAGKTARTTARLLENMLQFLHKKYEVRPLRPFDVIQRYDKDHPNGGLEELMKNTGFGCQKAKARGLRELISSNLDLRTCTVDQLERIHCIGPKTARCFIMHTRPGARHAGLDTHVLKWLSSLGYEVPKLTPKGRVYTQLEDIFLKLSDLVNKTPAALDLEIWNAYSAGGVYQIDMSNIKLPKQER